MTRMHNPPHPGEVLKDGVFADGIVSVTDAAALGVTRVSLSRVLNARAGVSAEMAVRLGKWLGTGPETWINMQGHVRPVESRTVNEKQSGEDTYAQARCLMTQCPSK